MALIWFSGIMIDSGIKFHAFINVVNWNAGARVSNLQRSTESSSVESMLKL